LLKFLATRLDDQVVVIAHQNPGEDSPVVEITHLADGLDETIRFDAVVEDEFAARDAAIDVVCEAGVSRYEISPMRGRDTAILPRQAPGSRL
jgi:hypothetical protein